MNELMCYTSPEIEIIMITEDVVRTSSLSEGEGELPIQPFAGF